MGISDRIRELAEKEGISFNALEKKVGLGKSVIYRWNDNAPSVDKVKKVADYFGVSVDYLLTGEEKEPREGNPRVAPFEKLFGELSAEEQMLIVQQMLEFRAKRS